MRALSCTDADASDPHIATLTLTDDKDTSGGESETDQRVFPPPIQDEWNSFPLALHRPELNRFGFVAIVVILIL